MCESSADAASDKKVFEKDMLFATLDTSIRKIDIPGRRPFLLSDTVGFIEDIPHSLIKAFRSTLSEVKFSDILLIVMDSSDPHYKDHKRVTEEVLRDLDSDSIPRIYVYNKSDLTEVSTDRKQEDKAPVTGSEEAEKTLRISALTGEGIYELKEALGDFARKNK
jgi:GTP-binding protein HflX